MNDIYRALLVPVGLRNRALQEQLRKLPIATASTTANTKIIQLVVNNYPAVCYIAVVSFDHQEMAESAPYCEPAGATLNPNRKVRYTSKGLLLKAKVYTIFPNPGPTSKHELGFVQHCTAKSDISTYSDNSKIQDKAVPVFPIGDSAIEANAPWYTKGIHNNLPHPAWKELSGTAPANHTVKLQMNDQFDRNFHPYYSIKPGPAPDYTKRVQSVARKQTFICYIVHRDSGGNFHPLMSKQYTIDVTFGVDASDQPSAFLTTAKADANVTLMFGSHLPATSDVMMNNMPGSVRSRWMYAAPNTTNYVPNNW